MVDKIIDWLGLIFVGCLGVLAALLWSILLCVVIAVVQHILTGGKPVEGSTLYTVVKGIYAFAVIDLFAIISLLVSLTGLSIYNDKAR